MRKEIIGSCSLYCGDAFEIMPDISGVDCVITDPPYGCTNNKWDIPIDLDRFWTSVKRASKKNAAQCIFCQMPFAAELYAANKKSFRYEYIYVKPKLVGWLDANRKPMRAHELIHVYYDVFPSYYPQKTPGTPYRKTRGGLSQNYGKAREHGAKDYDGARYPTSILDIAHDRCFYTTGYKPYPQHPTQKSVAAISLLVKTYSNHGEIIFDPFMGTGSTGVAAVKQGRAFIGIEHNKNYFVTACQRIADAYQERSLLDIAG